MSLFELARTPVSTIAVQNAVAMPWCWPWIRVRIQVRLNLNIVIGISPRPSTEALTSDSLSAPPTGLSSGGMRL